MPSQEKPKTATHPRMLASTQMFLVGSIAEVLAVLTGLLAIFVSLGSPSTTMAIFLVCIVLSIIASALAGILALVGLLRYSRLTGWNILLLLISIIFNPAVWLGLLALTA